MTLPVSEDTSTSSNKKQAEMKLLTPAAGVGSSLGVTSTRTAFLRFDAGSLADTLPSSEVSSAVLMVYLPTVTEAGDLSLHAVTQDWTESVTGNVAQPAFADTSLATIPSSSVVAKQFILIDVTQQVKAWLGTPASDFGFALTATGTTRVQFASKEGASLGYPAFLQIERSRVIGNEQLGSELDAAKIGDGSVDNDELAALDGVTSTLQPQINGLGASITGLQNNLAGKVSKAGDTMTGALVLPANGLTVGGNQLAVADGKVGIGTNSPSAPLEVRGSIRLGTTGNLLAPGGEENLRIVRGSYTFLNGVLSLSGGSGFSVVKSGSDVALTFTTAFSAPPTITCSQEVLPPNNTIVSSALLNVTGSGVTFGSAASWSGITWHFVAIGPR
ncbi:DNRLRE domain-containing protein [Luteolibacter sp. Y139]|uniref:DNRLRE domain-containing protein n=2 Tax=Luteolibacter soli TaxID=3135280 RepID=A0ABU9AR17_9BACT